MSRLLALALATAAVPALAQAPSAPVAAPDPARLAVARAVAGKIMPPGTYRTILQGSLNAMMSGMMSQMMDVPVQQFAATAGMPAEDAKKLGGATTRQVMSVIDPAFDERSRLSMTAMMDGMSDVLVKMEPDIREGLAEAYATRFSAVQLAELKAFFDTPTGSSFAAQQMTLMTDPAFMRRMQGVMPAIVKAMPDVIKRVQAATAHLPKPKKASDLTDAERARLAQLLGIPPEKLKQAKEPQ
ncbi:DUF2059 domain-containing protein [Sphingomonas sp. MMS24-J13]|uniref:DUF2059 domain-containing protein n=1 Tax=Sphingomonas sp. MMS24-J13 TaxID=3238686 RepID=UPI0038514288